MDRRSTGEKKTTTSFIIWPLIAGLGITAWFFLKGKPKPETIQLHGTVTSQQTGAALVNVRVELDNGLFRYTNSSGEYLFENMELRTYTIYFSKDGYDPVSGEISIIDGDNILDVALSPIIWEMPEYVRTYIEEWTHLGDITDWDIYHIDGNEATWEFDPEGYISAPTSLKIIAPATGEDFLMISNRPEVKNLKQGHIRSWVWGNHSIFPWTDGLQGFVYGFKNTNDYRVITWEMYGGWDKYRLSWWNDIDYQNQPKLHVLFEIVDRSDPNEWHPVKIDEWYEDRLEGDINRVGIFFSNHSSTGYNRSCNYDNTELFRVKV